MAELTLELLDVREFSVSSPLQPLTLSAPNRTAS
jgi:hypothetical protein